MAQKPESLVTLRILICTPGKTLATVSLARRYSGVAAWRYWRPTT
jgi:hypothetical protein